MGRYLSTFLTAVLAPAIGNAIAQAQLAAGCTTNSFTTPSWLVENLKSQVSASSTFISFHALNRATNTSVELACSVPTANATAGWQPCSAQSPVNLEPLVIEFQADKSTAWFRFNETWTCSDATPDKPITFTAVGNSSVALTCSTDETGLAACNATAPLLIKAALSSPVHITPSYVAGPQGHDTKGCSANSQSPSWSVTAAQFNLQKSSGALVGGNAFVIVQNNVLGYRASCGGLFTNTGGPQTLACSPQTAIQRQSKYQIDTIILLDPTTFAVTVNQSWFCDDANPASPATLTATGSTTLKTECTVFSDTTTFCTGTDSDSSFSGALLSAEPLPPYALSDPLPTADSCTISSIVAPTWRLSDFETVAPATTTTNESESGSIIGTLRFGIELDTGGQGTGYPSTVKNKGVHLGVAGEAQWYPCVFESIGEAALAPTNCSFRYEAATRGFGLRVEWGCNDLDVASPIGFSGEVQTTVPDVTCTTEGANTKCVSPEGKSWTAGVSSVMWT